MSIKAFAKQNNLYYENIAAYLNELNHLGYTAEQLDAPKHVIASAHSVVEQGQSITNTLGHLNEFVAAYRGRDGFAEHNKDHRNNIVGMTLGTWLEATLGRKPTLPEITVAVGVLAEERMIASFKPEDDPSMVSALTSGALASFWGGTIRSSTIQQLNSRQARILKRIRKMSNDGRMTRLQLFVESEEARSLLLKKENNKSVLKQLIGNGAQRMKGSSRKALQHSDADRQPHVGGGSDRPISGGGSAPSLHVSRTRKGDLDGYRPGHGDLVTSTPDEHANPDGFKPARDALLDAGAGVQNANMASLADVDDFDIFQMAEEVFSSMTLDDWAVIPDDYDPFAKLHPIPDGVLPTMETSKLSITP